jgi:hypothetical protein
MEVLPSTFPAVESKPEFPAKPEPPRFCAWCGTVHAGGVENCPTSAPVVRLAEGPPSKQPVASDVRPPPSKSKRQLPANPNLPRCTRSRPPSRRTHQRLLFCHLQSRWSHRPLLCSRLLQRLGSSPHRNSLCFARRR